MKYFLIFLLLSGILFGLDAGLSEFSTSSFSPGSQRLSWGPDAYGYIARDSNEPGGPAYQWIDISAIGTVVTGLGDDNIVGPFNIGFPFRYYWYDVTSFYVGSNGYLRFSGGGQLSHPFALIPSPLPPNDVVCFYTADFDPSSSGTVYYWSNNIDTLIVSFVNVPAWTTSGPTGSHSFQVVLSMVDTSITFNYGSQVGGFYDNAGMVGIENNAGDIGIQCYNTNLLPPNYSIKFYYPSATTYQVHDIAVQRVQNDISGGFFLLKNSHIQVNATIQNTGNQNEGDFYVVAEVRQLPTHMLIYSDSIFVDTLQAGQTFEANFSEIWTMWGVGDFYVRVRTTLSGDMVPSNDKKDVELHVIEMPGDLYFDDNTGEQSWSWSGGQGGLGLRFEPPAYPVKITMLMANLGTGTAPTLLQVYDDDGPDGQPGTLLVSSQVIAGTPGWYAVNVADSGVVINDGAFYVAWMMTGNQSSPVYVDTNSVGSRQAWEYTGVWATYRQAETSDPMLRVSLEFTQQTVFFDDFESGLGNWWGEWALTTEASHSPTHSYTDSPGGNYPNNAVLYGELDTGVDLSAFPGAILEFYTKYELETGFDFCYLEASDDGGITWYLLKTYNGEGVVTQFTQEVIDLGAFAGKPDVRIRFRLVTDGAYTTDGMYVDDFKIIGFPEDNSPPLLVYNPPQHYEGVPDSFFFAVKITDFSGVADASLTYWLNDPLPVQYTIQPYAVSNDTFFFAIPPQQHGAMVLFYIEATDNASSPNTAISDTMKYISGYHLIYDDGDPEYIVELNPMEMIATKFDEPPGIPPATLRLTTLLLRIYTDVNHPIDSVTVHVWDDAGGLPGADLIPPFKKYPDCTLLEPQAWTVVDLRSAQLEPGQTFWVGYQVPTNQGIAHLYDSPAVQNRSYLHDLNTWTPFNGDFHIRCVVGLPPVGIEPPQTQLLPKNFELKQNYPNPFNPVTTIPFALPEQSRVKLEIYNVLGERVALLADEIRPAGYYKIRWKPQNLASGIYFYRLDARGLSSGKHFQNIRKLILLK